MAYQSIPDRQVTASPNPEPAAAGDSRQRDPKLADLWDARAFDVDVNRYASAGTADKPSCLIFADVDHFKKVNDQYGHPKGDAVLKEVARRLATVVEGKGDAYRYGGEEMVLMLGNHSVQEGMAVAERARELLAASQIEGLTVTASFGLAIIPNHALTAKEWVTRADEAMYEAKSFGRNLVWVSGEPPPKEAGPRKVSRKEAAPGGLSDEHANALRKNLCRGELAPCPNDGGPLDAINVTGMYSKGNEYVVTCPDCGFYARLSNPEQQADS